MLIYETIGFLEVESNKIKQLCRSTISVSLGGTGRDAFAIQATLCDYLDNSEQRCRVAFYSKTLKRSLVFTVIGSKNQPFWQHGQESLDQLGFQLEDVNLKLSPAMLEVVLRDVPGILSPAEASKQRAKVLLQLAKFQKNYDEDPESALGKKAALKLSAEKRLDVRSAELRIILEDLFAPEEAPDADHESLVSQVKDLTSRLEAAETLAEAEATQREMSESITAAAEKRIQELEEVLVDVETKSSDTLKQKRKIVQLQGRIKELDVQLESAEADTGKEHNKQRKFVADVKAAYEQIAPLEENLKEAEKSLEQTHAQLTKEQLVKTQLDESLKAAELRLKVLSKELVNSEKKAAQLDEAVKTSEGTQAQLVEAQKALKDALNLNKSQEEELASAAQQNETLGKDLQQAEKACRDKTLNEEQVTAQAEQNKQLSEELKNLREEYDQESSIRMRLEKGAVEDDKHIMELEDTLAQMTESASSLPVPAEKKSTPGEVESLKVELQEQKLKYQKEQQSREVLETELDEAHTLIDSLEKMIRKTESVADEKLPQETAGESDRQKIQALEEKLKSIKNQLEQELIEQKKLAKAVAVAEKKLAEQEVKLVQGQVEQEERKIRETAAEETVVKSRPKSTKPLPHELRPAPKKGALFHPDWDLIGLPCQSSEQVFKAWETVFNVQISLEGYPSQYCMAFLVVLREGKQKKLYMLFRLKQSKHTLVCLPAKTPKNEASLKKTIKDGLQFLKMSGFDMEEMSSDHIDNTLKSYFQEA